MPHPGKIRALLATARIANVPSVVSNVWVGIAIAAIFQRWEHHESSILADALLRTLAGIFLYIGGNFLNDWHDRDWDQKNRPERALPREFFKPATYLLWAVGCGLAGVVAAFAVTPASGLISLAILVLIVIYTRWHKRAVWTVIPMGLCRALLPLMGFAGFSAEFPPHDTYQIRSLGGLFGMPLESTLVLFHGLALLLYIAALSLGARYESSPNPSNTGLMISKSGLLFSGLLAASLWITLSPKAGLLGLLPFGVWMAFCLTRYRRPIPIHVSALLAGIPLLDWIAMLAYCALQPPRSYPPALQPYLFTCLLLAPVAFFSGRLLQRIAPAT